MADLIVANEIAGGAVCGVAQMTYTVDGAAGKDFSAALIAASFRESVAIEDAARAYVAVVKQRERKIEAVSTLLATLSRCIATMDPKSTDTDKTSDWNAGLYTAAKNCEQYGISFSYETRSNGGTMEARVTFANAQRAQSSIKYELDREGNELQQDSVSLQSYISKRDTAFSSAARLVKKANNAASAAISSIGG